jgi:hypothetical protein
MHKIALDVDDVLAAFTPHAHNFHKVPMDPKVNYWCVETMNARLGEGWFSSHIAPVEDFWVTIPILSDPKDIDFEVDCYISSFPEKMYYQRMKWLVDNGFPIAPLYATSDKLSVCRTRGITHLVDDKPATIELLQGTEVKGIHFITPYADFKPVGCCSITNLKQVNQYL